MSELQQPIEGNEDLLSETLEQMAKARQDDPAEVYAQVFAMYLPRFNNIMNGLNSKGKNRVINHLMQYPFNEKTIKLLNNQEKEAIAIGHSILEAKYSMIMFKMLENIGLTENKGENNGNS